MKFLVVSAMLLTAAFASSDYIETLDDYHDFTKLNHDQLTAIVMCYMDQGPCNDLMLSYKQHYPGVVFDACQRCSEAQKAITKMFYSRIINELPEVFAQLKKFMDPEGTHFDKFLAAVN